MIRSKFIDPNIWTGPQQPLQIVEDVRLRVSPNRFPVALADVNKLIGVRPHAGARILMANKCQVRDQSEVQQVGLLGNTNKWAHIHYV